MALPAQRSQLYAQASADPVAAYEKIGTLTARAAKQVQTNGHQKEAPEEYRKLSMARGVHPEQTKRIQSIWEQIDQPLHREATLYATPVLPDPKKRVRQ